MLTLKLTPQLPILHYKSANLTLPSQITFYYLHTALELILNLGCDNYYSFMLMTSRHAIEANTAADYKAVPAFKQNPQIRYLNPYPGTFACLLELEAEDDNESSPYPYITGTGNDSQINAWLKEYCHFTESWQYHNQDFFRELYKVERKKENKKKSNATALSVDTIEQEREPSGYRPKTIDQKQQLWQSMCLMHQFDEAIRITVGSSRYSQSQLLEASKKDNLVNYCRYAILPTSTNWRKKELAEAFASNLQEHMWLTMVLLPKAGIDLYFRLCRLKENQKLSINLEEEADALKLLVYLGMVDLIFEAGETDIRVELSQDYKKSFQKFFQDIRNFGPKSECALYLPPKQKAGSWQKIIKGYEKLDYHADLLLRTYGILYREDLCEKLRACYGYQFSQTEFYRYLMLHLRLLEMVYTGRMLESRQRIVCPNDLNISYALYVQESPIPADQQKPLKKEVLDTYEECMMEQLEDLAHLLPNYTEDDYMIAKIFHQLTYAILENETWEDYLDILSDLLEDMEGPERICFWYELSKLYLHLPVAGLGGYSRMEYAEKNQLPNPYLILNDTEIFLDHWEDKSIFSLPFEVQGELYLSAEHFVEDGTDLSEKRMLKYAKKHLSPELARALQIHCYLISGSPRLLSLLEREAKQGNMEASEMLEQVKAMLGEDQD